MGLLSAPMAAAARRGDAFWLLELTCPWGTERFADISGGKSSTSQGGFKKRITGWGSSISGVDQARMHLRTMNLSITLDDTTKEWSNRLAAGWDPTNAIAVLYLAAKGIDQGDWYTRYTGRLSDWPQSGTKYTLQVAPNDARLYDELPRVLLSRVYFPDLLASVEGTPASYAYGYLSDRASTYAGYVVCPCVDTVNYKHCVCFGWAYDVPDVFVDGSRQTSGYTMSYETVKGVRWTLIDFTGDKSSNVVTANVKGYEDVGDRTGSFLSDPIDQLQHLLVNFVFGETSTGEWLSTSGIPIDTTSFTAAKAFLAGRAGGASYVGARLVSSTVTGLTLVNEACESSQISAYWKPDGTLALGVDSPHTDPLITDPWYKTEILSADFPPTGSRQAVKRQVVRRGASGTGQHQLEVQDSGVSATATDTINAEWGMVTPE